MPSHTAKEKEKNRRNKSADAIAANDASEQSTSTTNKPAPAAAAKQKPAEKIGTGRDDSQSNFARMSKKLRQDIIRERAAGNIAKADSLVDRLARLKVLTDQAK